MFVHRSTALSKWSFWLDSVKNLKTRAQKTLNTFGESDQKVISNTTNDRRACLMMYPCLEVEGEINEQGHACVWCFMYNVYPIVSYRTWNGATLP